jgi:outer membrane lipoprotein
MIMTHFRVTFRATIYWPCVVGFSLWISGCASVTTTTEPAPVADPSAAIVQIPPGDPQLAAVRDDIDAYQGRTVRWGGTIISVKNESGGSLLEVKAYRLGAEGRPFGSPDGVFVVRTVRPVDTATYAPGRAITVAGTIAGNELSTADGLYYLAPVVEASDYYAWYEPDRGYRYDYYDPYYGRYGYYPYDRYYYPYPRFHFGIGASRSHGSWHVGPFGGISIGF